MKLILTPDQAATVLGMMKATDALHGRLSVQFDGASVMYTPAFELNPQVTILHNFAATESYTNARAFARRYGLEG